MMIIIDTETEDIDDYDCYNRHRVKVQHDKGLNKMSGKLVKQKTKSANLMTLKSFNMKENIIYFLQNIATFPFTIYHLYRQEIFTIYNLYRQEIFTIYHLYRQEIFTIYDLYTQ